MEENQIINGDIPSLGEQTRQFLDFQKNFKQQNASQNYLRSVKDTQMLYSAGASSNNENLKYNCDKELRKKQLGDGINKVFFNYESNLSPFQLIDLYKEQNPDREAALKNYVVNGDSNGGCDPTGIYTQMGWLPQEEAVVEEQMYDPTRGRYSIATPDGGYMGRAELTPREEGGGTGKERLETFMDNFSKSLGNFFLDLNGLITHPGEIFNVVTKLPVGVAMNVTNSDDYIDYMADGKMKEWYDKANQIADGLGDYLVDRRRGTDEEGNLNSLPDALATIGNTLYTDPVGGLDDLMGIIEGGASLTDNVLRKVSKVTNSESLLKAANRAEKVANIADAASPSTLMTHPIRTAKGGVNLTKKAINRLGDTKPGRVLRRAAKNVGDAVWQSKKVRNLRGMVDSKLGKVLFPEAADLYKKLTPMDDKMAAKFLAEFGEEHGTYLNRLGIDGTPADVIDKLQFGNDSLYKQITQGMSEINEPLRLTGQDADYMRNMLLLNVDNVRHTTLNRNMINKIVEIYDNFKRTGEISPADALFSKRYFEKKTKFTYGSNKSVAPDKWQLATDIDNNIREILIKHAEDNGFPNMRELSNTIRKNRAIIDGVGKKAMSSYPAGMLELSDVIEALGSYDEKALAAAGIMNILNSRWFKQKQLDWGNALRGTPRAKWGNVDMDEIRRVNAENYINGEYAYAAGDGTPRLIDNIQGGVVATDNGDWATMRAQDAIAAADRYVETYAHSPRDVEKKVVERKPINQTTDANKWYQDDLFSLITD